MIQYDKEKVKKVCESALSMSAAAVELGIHYNTFIRIAKKLGCYNPNQAGKGLKKKSNGSNIPLEEILNGHQPQYQTYKLKNKLIKEGLKENKCEECGLSSWMGKQLNCELDHIDGNRTNHMLNNLRILCPNCHSQTSTFRAKNKRSHGEIGSTRKS